MKIVLELSAKEVEDAVKLYVRGRGYEASQVELTVGLVGGGGYQGECSSTRGCTGAKVQAKELDPGPM